MIDTIPVELIHHILSFLPLIDRVKCESINRKFYSICHRLWNHQKSIDENELPPVKWHEEFQRIYPNLSDQVRSDIFRWQLTIKCPRITKMTIDDEHLNSAFFIQRMPFIEHLTVKEHLTENTHTLREAIRLQTIVFENSDCNEFDVIQHLTTDIKFIEGGSLCDPWVNRWDEFFQHPNSGLFTNLVKLTVVISLQSNHQLENITKLQQLNHIRFYVGDDYDNNFLIKYLELRGSKLKGLELFQPVYHASWRNVYATISNNCFQLEHFGIKGYMHGQADYNDFKDFFFDFKSLKTLSLNIPRALTEDELVTVCINNPKLRNFNYTYYMPSLSPQKLKNCSKNYNEIKLRIDNFNAKYKGRRNIICGTSRIINQILSKKL